MSAEWLLIVDVDHVDRELEDEWNRWYDEVHLPEVAACPGFRVAARYVSEPSRWEPGGHHVTVYELDGPEAVETREFLAARGWGPFAGSVRAQVRVVRRRAGGGDA